MKNTKVIIVGGGLTGLSTAYFLKRDYLIFEKEQRPGGLCRTETENGFAFDYTGHLLHPQGDYVKRFIKKLLAHNLLHQKRNSWIYSYNTYTPYPYQANTYGLPAKVIKDCLLGLIEAGRQSGKAKNYEDWILKTFGKGIAQHFMLPYNQKLWTLPLTKISIDWVKKFGYIPTPNLEEFIDGALGINPHDYGYNSEFDYPATGGIEALVKALLTQIKPVKIDCQLAAVDVKSHVARFNKEELYQYDYLVSTIPLPLLIKTIGNVPGNVLKAARELEHTSVLNLNFGVEGKLKHNKHWIYFPEKKYLFHRVGFPSNISPYVAPSGNYTISVEVAYSKTKPLNQKTVVAQVKRDLQAAEILGEKDRIVTTRLLNLEYAYVIYKTGMAKKLKTIKSYLNKHHIYTIGRFGSWEYSEMEKAILDGKQMAEELNIK